MPAKTYVDLHRQVSAEIEAEVRAAVGRLGPSAPAVRSAVTGLLRHRELAYPLSVLPMIVHAVETGVPGPAAPLAAVHVLWWTSACHLDDLADGQGAVRVGDLHPNEALLAAVVAGLPLPVLALRSPRIPEAVRGDLTAEVLNGLVGAAEGQLRDLRTDVACADRERVVAAYRGKSGAPFAMITAMAAILAGAPAERTELWREFGYVFGVLWQIFNDQEDILSGRDEDLANGTVTYLLACALQDAPPAGRARLLKSYAAAPTSGSARAEVTAALVDAPLLRSCRDDLDAFRGDAYRLLRALGGDEEYLAVLRHLVDESSRMRLKPRRAERLSAGRP
ncbi:polyprenyl synthetase family protein [Streptomyces sp. NPDC004082]|uniref:polyprenyl synthetase family protein n=1 Tax=Streptomyces sp. NPDC005481 TaxID=3154881 RepID=UPI0033A51BFD